MLRKLLEFLGLCQPQKRDVVVIDNSTCKTLDSALLIQLMTPRRKGKKGRI